MLTDEACKRTEQTIINTSPFLFAMMGNANKYKMEDDINASNKNNGTCKAVQKSDCCGQAQFRN